MPKTKHLEHIVQLIHNELPSLRYDLENASTVYTVQQCAQRVFNLVQLVLYHLVEDTYGKVPLPPPGLITQATIVTPSNDSMSEIAPSSVPSVFITQNGTQIVPPIGSSQSPITVPRGAPVVLSDLVLRQGSAELPPEENGVPNIIVRSGAPLPPEVEAILEK